MKRDIVAIGASAGGLDAVSALLRRLPAGLPAVVLVVVHRSMEAVSQLPALLQRVSQLRVRVAREGERIEHGTCFLGPPDRHLTVTNEDRIHLVADGFYRSHTVDVLFTSLAQAAGPRTIGVVLSGMLKDGSFGLKSIKEAGGMVLVQDPAEAEFPSMPVNAIQHDGKVDVVGPVDDLAEFICETLGCTPVGERREVAES